MFFCELVFLGKLNHFLQELLIVISVIIFILGGNMHIHNHNQHMAQTYQQTNHCIRHNNIYQLKLKNRTENIRKKYTTYEMCVFFLTSIFCPYIMREEK